jgi:FKBP-type peptidyl-prolyl cis-trans isomerase
VDPLRRALALFCAAVLATACTGESEPGASPSASTSESPVPVATAKPKVTVPKDPAPTELKTEDLVKGTGPAVFPGQVVSVHYVGVLYRNGEEFDTSWDGGHPFQFRLGDGAVIEGWDKGLLGMRVGGRRALTIPPAQGYGGSPGHQLANETLYFVVDVISTGGAPAGAGD